MVEVNSPYTINLKQHSYLIKRDRDVLGLIKQSALDEGSSQTRNNSDVVTKDSFTEKVHQYYMESLKIIEYER